VNYITTRNNVDRVVADTTQPLPATLLTLLLVATWSLTHHYKGITLDGELYAFQAFAKLHPALRSDVYLMGNSQDGFTLFSPFYAFFIRCLGLWSASVTLFALSIITFVVAVWFVARSLWDTTSAWLSAAACVVITCGYGAYSVFTYSESYLTARSLAEALVIVALACHLRGLSRWSWAISAAAMFIHPLMALPGLLLLMSVTVPFVYAATGAVLGVLTALAITWVAPHAPQGAHFLTIIRGPWLDMIWERSQYIFLQYWRLEDWESHARPVLCLTIAALVSEDPRVRRLCVGAMLVGAAGLAVALIASNIGPVAILLQGQAWRWFWVTGFVSVLTLAPTVLRLWREGGAGAVCAVLLFASWTFPPVNEIFLAAAALGLWCVRKYMQAGSRKLLQWLAYSMMAAMLAWTIGNIWSVCTSPPVETLGEPLSIERLRSIYSLEIPAMAVIGLALQWLRSGTSPYASGAVSALLIGLCMFTLHGAFNRGSKSDISAGIEGLSEWRNVIPPTSNVLVLPSTKGTGFIWFTLQRPSYLTVDQSAGVVFSEEIAQEIRRRSQVLLPVMEPDWKVLSHLSRAKTEREKSDKEAEKPHPLTAGQLTSICSDPQLGFVIAKERLGFDAISSTAPGPWKDWNLYSCNRVLQQAAG
jgi:hypothetical protein